MWKGLAKLPPPAQGFFPEATCYSPLPTRHPSLPAMPMSTPSPRCPRRNVSDTLDSLSHTWVSVTGTINYPSLQRRRLRTASA